MPKSNDKKQNIDSVLQTAYALFLQNGIENTTKEMLVRASGISRSSVDRYFKTKLDCVLQTAQWVRNNVTDKNISVQQYLRDQTHTGFELLRIYLEIVRDIMFNNPDVFALCVECRTFVYADFSHDVQYLSIDLRCDLSS